MIMFILTCFLDSTASIYQEGTTHQEPRTQHQRTHRWKWGYPYHPDHQVQGSPPQPWLSESPSTVPFSPLSKRLHWKKEWIFTVLEFMFRAGFLHQEKHWARQRWGAQNSCQMNKPVNLQRLHTSNLWDLNRLQDYLEKLQSQPCVPFFFFGVFFFFYFYFLFFYFLYCRSPAQVGCMRQALGPGALGRPRRSGWRGRWEGG